MKQVVIAHQDGTSTPVDEGIKFIHTMSSLPAGHDYIVLIGASGKAHTFRLKDIKRVHVTERPASSPC